MNLWHLLRRAQVSGTLQVLLMLLHDLRNATEFAAGIVLYSVHQPLLIAPQSRSPPAQTHRPAPAALLLILADL